MTHNKQELFEDVMNIYDLAHDLMCQYDSLPHEYDNHTLYKQELHVLSEIGNTPGTTITQLSQFMLKTPSACSQLTKKLQKKGLVKQIRNEINNRIYNLFLTEEGEKIHKLHEAFDIRRRHEIYDTLKDFSIDEYNTYIKIQESINKTLIEAIETPEIRIHK